MSPEQGAQCEICVVASGRQRISWAGQAENGVLGELDGGTKGALQGKALLPPLAWLHNVPRLLVSKYSAWLSCLILELRYVCTVSWWGWVPWAQGEP